ncbi:hypothetical protein R1sor_021354 [Riccia sorocarpa]|uniref:Uncharacterized protein n=1 Tax=Riccia sorocarpa TaxID=122646 RepID=A0ABD3GHL1_9MARC
MTRLPRPKYPSDTINYHESRKPTALQSAAFCVVHNSKDEPLQHETEEVDPDVNLGEVVEDSEESDQETMNKTGAIVEIHNHVVIPDFQPVQNPECCS